jgi:hypothetical protein
VTTAVINGFMCSTPREAVSAHAGYDPRPQAQIASEAPTQNESGFGDQPAVVLGGALATQDAAAPASAVPSAAGPRLPHQRAIDILT